jgi:predicted nucleic acid-binding protein
LYDEVLITREVELEFSSKVPKWIEVKDAVNIPTKHLLMQTIGEGESSGIALALNCEESLLVLDDLKARKIAQSLNLRITGSLGILVRARKEGLIEVLKPILYKLQQTNFRLAPHIVEKILKELRE